MNEWHSLSTSAIIKWRVIIYTKKTCFASFNGCRQVFEVE